MFHFFRSRGLLVTLNVDVLGPSSTSDVTSTSMELESEVGWWGACPLELLAWFTSQGQSESDQSENEESSSNPMTQVCWISFFTLMFMHTDVFIY